jgi:hypothetical protein
MTVKYTKQEQIAIQIAKDVVIGATIQATIDNGIKELRTASKGTELGTVKSGDARMVRIQETLKASKGKDGKVLSEQTVKNYMTAIRKAYNENKPFSMNAYRAKTSKGSQAGKGKVAPTTGVKFKGDAKLDDIVKGLRSMFNKFKENDKTTSLASYLIDALDDFEGESK